MRSINSSAASQPWMDLVSGAMAVVFYLFNQLSANDCHLVGGKLTQQHPHKSIKVIHDFLPLLVAGTTSGLKLFVRILPGVTTGIDEMINLNVFISAAKGALPLVALKDEVALLLPAWVLKFFRVGHNRQQSLRSVAHGIPPSQHETNPPSTILLPALRGPEFF